MKRDDIDKVLGNEESISPSPDFLASVMRAVRREAASLPPFEFPWLRLLPAILALFLANIRVIWDFVALLYEPDVIAAFREQMSQFVDMAGHFGVQWIVLAIVITLVALTLAVVVVGGRHYSAYDSRVSRLLRATESIVRRSG